MKKIKLADLNLSNFEELSRSEMKKIMAGSGTGGTKTIKCYDGTYLQCTIYTNAMCVNETQALDLCRTHCSGTFSSATGC